MIPFSIEDSVATLGQVSEQRSQPTNLAEPSSQDGGLFAQSLYPVQPSSVSAPAPVEIIKSPGALDIKSLEEQELLPENPLANELLRLAQNPKISAELKKWGQALQENDLLKKSTVLPFLAGQKLTGDKIDLVIKNSKFVNQALGENLDDFFTRPMPLSQLVSGVDLDLNLLDVGLKFGLTPGQDITPLQFFKALGVDPNTVKYQINALKDKLGSGQFGLLAKADALEASPKAKIATAPIIKPKAQVKKPETVDPSVLAPQISLKKPITIEEAKPSELAQQVSGQGAKKVELFQPRSMPGIPLKDLAGRNEQSAALPFAASELKLTDFVPEQAAGLGLQISQLAFNSQPAVNKDLAPVKSFLPASESMSFLESLALKKEMAMLTMPFTEEEEQEDTSEQESPLDMAPQKIDLSQGHLKSTEAFDLAGASIKEPKELGSVSAQTKQEALAMIADKINLAKQANKSEALVSFEDKALGQLSMQIQIDGQNVKIHTDQGQDTLSQWLGSDFSELKESLSRQSLKLVEVASGKDFSQREQAPSWQFFEQNSGRRSFEPSVKEEIFASKAVAGYSKASSIAQVSRSLNSRHIQLAV